MRCAYIRLSRPCMSSKAAASPIVVGPGGVSLTEVIVWLAAILAAALVVFVGAFVTRQ